jgi:hypothetical protein
MYPYSPAHLQGFQRPLRTQPISGRGMMLAQDAAPSPASSEGLTPVVMLGAGTGLGLLTCVAIKTVFPKIKAPKWVVNSLLGLGTLTGLAITAYPIGDATKRQRNDIAFGSGVAAGLGVGGNLQN